MCGLAGEAHFYAGLNVGLLKGSTLGAELVAFDGDGGALLVATNNAAINHQLHGAGIVEKHRPVHGDFDRHPRGQHILGGEPDAAAADVEGFTHTRFGDALPVEHLVAHFLFNMEAALHSALALVGGPYLILIKVLNHAHRLPFRKITLRGARAQYIFGYSGGATAV